MLAALCRDVQVHDVFADHSSLSVKLDIQSNPLTTWTWPRPRQIPWEAVDVLSWQGANSQCDDH